MNYILMLSGLITIVLSFFSCQQRQELIEVEIPERSIFEQKVKSIFPDPATLKTTQGPFEMEGLPYLYDELIPFLSPENVELHYSKHHLEYANALNNDIINTPFEKKSIDAILKNGDLNTTELRNNAGGYYNHNLYWKSITPKINSMPSEALSSRLINDFGSVASFKDKFREAANQFFGSGWVWLVLNNDTLEIQTTQNQDNPLMFLQKRGIPLLCIDLWEHAYYPTYKNERKEYIDQFILHIDWDFVSKSLDN